MKRFPAILLLLFCLSAASQNTNPVFTLKPAVGINGCQIHGDSYSGFNKAGIFGGVAVNAYLSPRLSIDLGFYFSQKGARHNSNPDKGDFSYYFVNLNYLDLPLSLKYYLNKDYFVTAGPSVAYLMGYKEIKDYINYTGMYPFTNFEYGVNVGLGKKIKDKIFVEVRSSNSFAPIRSYGVAATQVFYPNALARAFNKGLYNNILTAFISYKLDFKRKNRAEE